MKNRGVMVATAALSLAGTLGTQAAQQSAPTAPQELKVQAPQIEVKEIAIGRAPSELSITPISVEIYRFPVAQAAP